MECELLVETYLCWADCSPGSDHHPGLEKRMHCSVLALPTDHKAESDEKNFQGRNSCERNPEEHQRHQLSLSVSSSLQPSQWQSGPPLAHLK